MPARALLALLCIPLAAHATRPFTPEELLATRRPEDLQLSPDGKWAAFTVKQKSLAANRDLKDVWLLPLGGGEARPFTRDGRSEHPRWSPDGKHLLVTSERPATPEVDAPQLWIYDLAAPGDPRRITALWGGADQATWSPDGRLIAFASDVYPECADDACNRKREADRAASKVKARTIDHLFARHWVEWRDGKRSHVFVYAVESGALRDLTPGNADWPTWRLGDADDLAFSADGSTLYVSHKEPQREAWSTNSDLYAIPTAGGAPKNLTAGNPGDDATPRLSPDGRLLAWRAQARDGFESDQWRLQLRDLRSGKVTTLGAALDESIEAFAWRRDGKGLVAAQVSRGRFVLRRFALDGSVSEPEPLPGADFDLGPAGELVVVGSGMNRPPELFRVAAKAQRLTGLNLEQSAGLDLGPAPQEQWVESTDGAKVQSWILKPPGLRAGDRAPLLVLIHGGPQGAWEDVWGMRWNAAAFAARGYIVLMPNPRGSRGYGQKFLEDVSKDWGGLAYQDILRSVDAAEKLDIVEPGRTCAAGASFGGYMIDWIAGHTDRFRCLVSHDGVFDLRASYGSTEELWFPEFEFGGPYWEHPELYEKLSPSSYVQNFKTPTLVVQGELDFRVGVEQGLGMFTALQRKGVESKLLEFPDEGHWVLKPRNSQLWYRTVLDWVDAHAKAPAVKPSGRAPPRAARPGR